MGVVNGHIIHNDGGNTPKSHYEHYFKSNTSLPEVSLLEWTKFGTKVGLSPSGSNYHTPRESRNNSVIRSTEPPQSPSDKPRQRSLSPGQRQQMASTSLDATWRSGGEKPTKKKYQRSRRSKSPNDQDENPDDQDGNADELGAASAPPTVNKKTWQNNVTKSSPKWS